MRLSSILCRHDYYWSERHRSDRCRRCGRTQEAATASPWIAEPATQALAHSLILEDAEPATVPADRPRIRSSEKALKAQARARRTGLLDALERLVDGEELSRSEVMDAVMAVIEDAHSADPVLFGPEAVSQFARLHEAREAMAGTDWRRLQESNPRHPAHEQRSASRLEGFA